MPIPALHGDGWLPEGHHAATWDEIEERFGGEAGSKRALVAQRLFAWRDACRAKRLSGLLIVNGSFISSKQEPSDVDCLFVYDEETGVILREDEEARRLIDYSACKAQGIGDILCSRVRRLRRTQRCAALTALI